MRSRRRESRPETEQFQADIRIYVEHHEAIQREWRELIAHHSGHWVASYRGEFLFGASLDDVLTAATSRRWELRLTAVKFLDAEQAPTLR